jgi:hypothetical protein
VVKFGAFIVVLILCLITFFIFRSNDNSSLNIVFDQEKWSILEDGEYPFRNNMLGDLMINDSLRRLNKTRIIDILGSPERSKENHIYYLVDQTLLGLWPMKKKYLVIKFTYDDKIEWMKIHG